MISFLSNGRSLPGRLLALVCAGAFSGCARRTTVVARTDYRVVWTATRTSDHAPLISIAQVVALGSSSTIRTDSKHPTEDKPAFPRFTAHLSATKTAGVLQLVTRASLREAARNKKGKLKVTRRDIGALLPIRPGETQPTSLPSDPVQIQVHLER